MGLANESVQPTPHAVVLVLGGSFDPVHCGHIALARRCIELLAATELRIIPTGQPWQKSGLVASAEQRVAMLERAFADLAIPLVIDQQEIARAEQHQATYSIDTLRNLRSELGENASIIFAIGADQLQNLSTWREWRQLFELAHFCAATRPGFDISDLDPELEQEWQSHQSNIEHLRSTPAGGTLLIKDLAEDVSATQIRRELVLANPTNHLVPAAVLDYIQQHFLYR
jgi:nicotinate-nucleotide adenylyltransferase